MCSELSHIWLQSLATVVPTDVLADSMLPLIIRLAKDTVPNIRFNVAKVFQTVIPLLSREIVQERVKPCLQELSEDSDDDVKYFATVALRDTM